MMALQRMGVKVDHLFACDINKAAKETIMANYPPQRWYDDLLSRDNKSAPKAELYVAGFPCQPFSLAGKTQGFEDEQGRGTVFWGVRDYIRHAQPKAFVLENVSGLYRLQGGYYFKQIMESLDALKKYNIHHQLLNTKEHGLPQNRARIYIIGIRKDVDEGTFAFPEPIPMPSIENFLDKMARKPNDADLPQRSAGTARRNVKVTISELKAKKIDPFSEPWVVDIDSSTYRMKYLDGLAPCFTCARRRGHWITNRGRRMNKTEMLRLQGLLTPKEGFKQVVSDSQLGAQIGNAMSGNVLERIFVRLLPAAGLVPARRLRDRWAASKLKLAKIRACLGMFALKKKRKDRTSSLNKQLKRVKRSSTKDASKRRRTTKV